ncbi:unnamed protein product [Vitrella brassicaformis CCMP3155]|uniref:Uncharacterized protein n=1 Tax=Vitrella brassicaformis (strain CCMP3155) TaxID=1169540 RepID=A0A0G4EHM5_VITBC|nr:unnamed protein product [Vitrella brassicaformis CCMP3155]|eukprot:CEL95483.1 unnamed protein product [Vitrella brassicaformis CCMP3155]
MSDQKSPEKAAKEVAEGAGGEDLEQLAALISDYNRAVRCDDLAGVCRLAEEIDKVRSCMNQRSKALAWASERDAQLLGELAASSSAVRKGLHQQRLKRAASDEPKADWEQTYDEMERHLKEAAERQRKRGRVAEGQAGQFADDEAVEDEEEMRQDIGIPSASLPADIDESDEAKAVRDVLPAERLEACPAPVVVVDRVEHVKNSMVGMWDGGTMDAVVRAVNAKDYKVGGQYSCDSCVITRHGGKSHHSAERCPTVMYGYQLHFPFPTIDGVLKRVLLAKRRAKNEEKITAEDIKNIASHGPHAREHIFLNAATKMSEIDMTKAFKMIPVVQASGQTVLRDSDSNIVFYDRNHNETQRISLPQLRSWMEKKRFLRARIVGDADIVGLLSLCPPRCHRCGCWCKGFPDAYTRSQSANFGLAGYQCGNSTSFGGTCSSTPQRPEENVASLWLDEYVVALLAYFKIIPYEE